MYKSIILSFSKSLKLWPSVPIINGYNQWRKWRSSDVRYDYRLRPQMMLKSVYLLGNEDIGLTIEAMNKEFVNHCVEIRVPLYNGNYEVSGQNAGTGLIVDSMGYVLTNAHVINEAYELYIRPLVYSPSKDGIYPDKSLAAEVVYVEPSLDLALIRTKQCQHKWTQNTLAEWRSSDVQMGEPVVAFGNPEILYCLTDGLVNGVDNRYRLIYMGPDKISYNTGFSSQNQTFTSHTCRISQGFSGGPLVDMTGKVVAINFASYGESTQISTHFTKVKDFLNTAMNYGVIATKNEINFVTNRSLGVSVYPFDMMNQFMAQNDSQIKNFGEGLDYKGLIVMESLYWMLSMDETNEYHLKKFDIILKVNGNEVNSVDELKQYVKSCDELEITIVRDGNQKLIKVKTMPLDLLMV